MKPLPTRPIRSFGFAILEVPVDDEIRIEPAGEKVEHILHGRNRQPFSGLLCKAGDVRRQQNLAEPQQLMILRGLANTGAPVAAALFSAATALISCTPAKRARGCAAMLAAGMTPMRPQPSTAIGIIGFPPSCGLQFYLHLRKIVNTRCAR
jgi:hypothetical protein